MMSYQEAANTPDPEIEKIVMDTQANVAAAVKQASATMEGYLWAYMQRFGLTVDDVKRHSIMEYHTIPSEAPLPATVVESCIYAGTLVAQMEKKWTIAEGKQFIFQANVLVGSWIHGNG